MRCVKTRGAREIMQQLRAVDTVLIPNTLISNAFGSSRDSEPFSDLCSTRQAYGVHIYEQAAFLHAKLNK